MKKSTGSHLGGYGHREYENDLALCRDALHEFHELARHCHGYANRASHPMCRMTLEVAHLFCEGAANSLKKFLEASTPRVLLRAVPPGAEEDEPVATAPPSPDSNEWRPGSGPGTPLP